MKFTKEHTQNIIVRMAQTPAEIEAAQRLRYEVFFEELGATPSEYAKKHRIDRDEFDEYADHMIVLDQSEKGEEKIIGTYRLLRQAEAEKHGRFYSATEYDLTNLINSKQSLLELGRSCVLLEYRSRPVLQLLWQGIGDYISRHEIDILFGCASFQGTDINQHAESLSYLHHHHLSPSSLRVKTLDEHYVDMNILQPDDINPRKAFAALPPLLKGYIRAGSTIGDGAYIDSKFNTIDVFIMVQTHMFSPRLRKHYERKINRALPGHSEKSDTDQLIKDVSDVKI